MSEEPFQPKKQATPGLMSAEQREKIREADEAATDWVGTYRCCGARFEGTLAQARSGTHVCKPKGST